ncbi:MAG: hypothetical protein ACKV0T_30685 [Planctomycetales bacterium]
MPLRDHFRSPLDEVHSWDELHGMWPATIVRKLNDILPEPYFAAPAVHLGTLYEIDVGTYYDSPQDHLSSPADGGGLAVVADAPPQPTLTFEPQLPSQDTYEVRLFDSRRHRRLVAAIEIVSPSNKDRSETRGLFVAKVAALLKHGICVSVVDVVSTSRTNLYDELMQFLASHDARLGDDPPPMYALTIRPRPEGGRRLMDSWYHPLEIGHALPTLPVWFRESSAVLLDLEATYEDTCRALRIR